MSQKIYSNLDIKGNATIGDIANATSDTDKFLVSDAGVVKYRTGSEMLSDLGVAPGVASNIQHQVKAGVAINKGQAVYVTGADGTNMIVGLASNASEATSSKTMGLMTSTVAANGFGNVVAEGLLAGLDTSTANAGDPVWLGTNGSLIYGLANKPYAPAHLVFIGIVTRVNNNNGEIFVKVQNGFELNEIHDVDLYTTTPTGGNILAFEGAPVNLWRNKTIPSVLGYTPVSQARTLTINGTTFDLSADRSWTIASGVTSFNTRTGAITLTSGDITGALGYTPYNSSNPAGYISSYTETDPTVPAHVKSITTTEKSNWNTAFSWGNHASAGYVPSARTITINGTTFDLSANRSWTIASGVTSFNTRTGAITLSSSDVTTALGYTPYNATNPNGYISSYTETDPTVPSHVKAITTTNISNWNTAFSWGNHAGLYMTQGQTRTDINSINNGGNRYDPSVNNPTNEHYAVLTYGNGGNVTGQLATHFVNGNLYSRGYNSTWSSWRRYWNDTDFTNSNISNWNTAFGWGNHASAGYVPQARTITINGVSQDLSANRSFTVSSTVTSGFSLVNQGTASNTPSSPTANMGVFVDTYAFIDLATAHPDGGWIDFSKANGTDYAGRIRYNNTSDYFSISAGSNEQVRIFNSNAEALGSFRAPIFYDSNNTGYYGDFASSGTSLSINGGIVTTAPTGAILLHHQVAELTHGYLEKMHLTGDCFGLILELKVDKQ